MNPPMRETDGTHLPPPEPSVPLSPIEYAQPPRAAHASETLIRLAVTSVVVWVSLVLSCLVVDTKFAAGIFVAAAAGAALNAVALSLVPPARWELRRKARDALWLTLPPVVLTIAVAVVLPQLGRPRESAQRVKCASNLRQIGQSVQAYASDHRGWLPPSLDLLLLGDYLTPGVVICPSSDDERAEGPTTQAVAAAVRTVPKHCSYVYLGGGHTHQTATSAFVLAYEHRHNHDDRGMNFLYGDGTVRWLDKPQADRVLAELQAGRNPPR